MLTRPGWSAALALSLVACAPAQPSAHTQPLADALHAAIDDERSSAGLPPLDWSPCAAAHAASRAAALAPSPAPLVHTALDDVLTTCRVAVAGENLARHEGGPPEPPAVVATWMTSPGHRANILDPQFTALGAACTAAPQVRCAVVFVGPTTGD